FSCNVVQHRGGIDRLCQSPVHTVMDYRFAFPICSINNTGSSICVPCVFHCTVKEIFCCFYVPGSSLSVFLICRQSPLCDQSCPFNTVSRSSPVWLKLICRLILITFQIR